MIGWLPRKILGQSFAGYFFGNVKTHQNIEHNLGFGEVGGRRLDEDVFGVEADLGVIAVDDGRHGQDDAVRIVDDRVDGAVLDDGQICFQVAVSLEVWNKRVGANVIVYWPKVRIWAAEQQLQELRCVSNFSSSPNNSKPKFNRLGIYLNVVTKTTETLKKLRVESEVDP